ncbi:MAG TPA: hypothetical protein VKA86_07960 [Candidatus Krumholzibacteria bacterium]|nr:hypothetical protein [Candidatus Krumholzibacteria bacterium]
MSVRIRRVQYYTAHAADRPGSAYQILQQLSDAQVDLLAFSCLPIGPSSLHVTLFPEDPDRLERVARSFGLDLTPPQEAILVHGDDELGALTELHRQLYDHRVDVYATTGLTDAQHCFGYVIYVRHDEIDRACEALGC